MNDTSRMASPPLRGRDKEAINYRFRWFGVQCSAGERQQSEAESADAKHKGGKTLSPPSPLSHNCEKGD